MAPIAGSKARKVPDGSSKLQQTAAVGLCAVGPSRLYLLLREIT